MWGVGCETWDAEAMRGWIMIVGGVWAVDGRAACAGLMKAGTQHRNKPLLEPSPLSPLAGRT